jgi:hypothetical protein
MPVSATRSPLGSRAIQTMADVNEHSAISQQLNSNLLTPSTSILKNVMSKRISAEA